MKKIAIIMVFVILLTIHSASSASTLMDLLVESENPKDWMEVANSSYATSEQLLQIAEKLITKESEESITFRLEELEIARKLAENSAITEEVMKKLAESESAMVWKIMALSDKAGESVLLEIAKNAIESRALKYDEESLAEIALAVSKNPASTDKVMQKLAESDNTLLWSIVALSEKSGETALYTLADKCVCDKYYAFSAHNLGIDDNARINIAIALYAHPATTDSVMTKLAESRSWEVCKIANEWLAKNR